MFHLEEMTVPECMALKVRERIISFGALHVSLWFKRNCKTSVQGSWPFCSNQMLQMPTKHPRERLYPTLKTSFHIA